MCLEPIKRLVELHVKAEVMSFSRIAGSSPSVALVHLGAIVGVRLGFNLTYRLRRYAVQTSQLGHFKVVKGLNITKSRQHRPPYYSDAVAF